MTPQTHPIDRDLCTLLRLHRLACGVTQQTLGDRLGLSPAQIDDYETGRSALTVEGFLRIVHSLGSPPAAVLAEMEYRIAPASDPGHAEADARMEAFVASQRGRQVIRALAMCEDTATFDAFADLLLSVSMTRRSGIPSRARNRQPRERARV